MNGNKFLSKLNDYSEVKDQSVVLSRSVEIQSQTGREFLNTWTTKIACCNLQNVGFGLKL